MRTENLRLHVVFMAIRTINSTQSLHQYCFMLRRFSMDLLTVSFNLSSNLVRLWLLRTFLSIWIVIAFYACFFPPIVCSVLCGQCKMLIVSTKSADRWANARIDKIQTILCYSQMNDRLHNPCIQTNDKSTFSVETHEYRTKWWAARFLVSAVILTGFCENIDSSVLCSFDLMS